MRLKKIESIFLISLIAMALFGCTDLFNSTSTSKHYISIKEDGLTLNVAEEVQLINTIRFDEIYWVVEDNSVLSVDNNYVAKAIAVGTTMLNAYYTKDDSLAKEISVVVYFHVDKINIEGKETLQVNESTTLHATTSPMRDEQFIWSSDDDIVSVTNDGVVTALKSGLTTVTATLVSDPTFKATYTIFVQNLNDDIEGNNIDNQIINQDTTLNLTTSPNIFDLAIQKASSFTVGICNYQSSFMGVSLHSIGSAIIYRRIGIMNDLSMVENVDANNTLVTSYRYYFITSKSIINNASFITIYVGDEYEEIDAEIVQSDNATDLSVGYFDCNYYLSMASFANSDNILAGSLCVSVGTADSFEYYNTPAKGIVSFVNRYLAEDTDGDEVNDTDTCYIQHSAALAQTSAGGPLVDLNGNVIGMNSYNMTDSSAENMGFAIASNTVKQIVDILETGNIPERPKLLVTIMSVKTLIQNDGFYSDYYGYAVPDGVTSGMYVTEVTEGGVAYAAGVLAGDIVVEFNGTPIQFSYQLRSELYKFVAGSGMETTIKVYRGNELLILDVVF